VAESPNGCACETEREKRHLLDIGRFSNSGFNTTAEFLKYRRAKLQPGNAGYLDIGTAARHGFASGAALGRVSHVAV
jgi:hypothetical protein